MQNLVLGATFLITALAVGMAVAGSPAVLVVLLALGLAGLIVWLPAILLSLVLRRVFDRCELELDEPQKLALRLVFSGTRRGAAIKAHPGLIATARSEEKDVHVASR